jgi:hypothetical protein
VTADNREYTSVGGASISIEDDTIACPHDRADTRPASTSRRRT